MEKTRRLCARGFAASIAAIIIVAPSTAGARPKIPERIAERATSVIGVPYSAAGTTPAGFDCSGFTMWVFAGHGIALPHSSQAQYALGAAAGNRYVSDRSALRVGDLVFHKTTGATVGHVGIYVGDDRFVSATSSSGIQIESLYDPYYWGEKWVGAVRLGAMTEVPQARPRKAAPAARRYLL